MKLITKVWLSWVWQYVFGNSAIVAFMAWLALCHRLPVPVNSPHKGSVTRKMFPFHDVFMMYLEGILRSTLSMGVSSDSNYSDHCCIVFAITFTRICKGEKQHPFSYSFFLLTFVCVPFRLRCVYKNIQNSPWITGWHFNPLDFQNIGNAGLGSKQKPVTVRFRYIAVIFLRITDDRQPIAPPTSAMYGVLFVSADLTEVLSLSLLCFVHHLALHNRDILGVYSIWFSRSEFPPLCFSDKSQLTPIAITSSC